MSKKIYAILAILFAMITASLGIITLIYAKTITANILYLLTVCLTSLTSLMFVGAVLKSNPQNTKHTSSPQSNYIECHNCTEHYDCERTYLGGCTDGKAYNSEELTKDMRKEKGTTIKIKNIAKLSSYGAYIDEEFIYTDSLVENKKVIVGNIAEYMYDLEQEIKRLMEENSELRVEIVSTLNEKTELQKQIAELKERLHMIFALGFDYDGCDKAESLKGLIDELVKITQMGSKEFAEYYKGK